MPTQVWINKRFTDQASHPGDKCITMTLPDECPICHLTLKVYMIGDANSSFGLDVGGNCQHTITYEDCWAIRIVTDAATKKVVSVSAGMFCKRCHDFNAYGEPNQSDGSYKCFSCRRT
jgi:hypothetical protein